LDAIHSSGEETTALARPLLAVDAFVLDAKVAWVAVS